MVPIVVLGLSLALQQDMIWEGPGPCVVLVPVLNLQIPSEAHSTGVLILSLSH